MARLVRMVVSVVPAKIIRHNGEKAFQFLRKPAPPPHQAYQSFNVVRNKPSLLPRIRLHASLSVLLASLPLKPAAICGTRAHPPDLL